MFYLKNTIVYIVYIRMVAMMKYFELTDKMVAEGRTTYENLSYLSFIVHVKLLRKEQSSPNYSI